MLINRESTKTTTTHPTGIGHVIKTIKTKAFVRLGAHITEAIIPECEKHGNLTREYIKCFVRDSSCFA